MGEAFEAIQNGLESAGYTRFGLFRAPEGFVLVTGLERMKADGSVLPGHDRWRFETGRARSLGDYIARLFFGETGQYRLLAFLVSSAPPVAGDGALPAADATKLYLSGATSLPEQVSRRDMNGIGCHVWIYEYQRSPGDVHQVVPATLPALKHLESAGLIRSLQSGVQP